MKTMHPAYITVDIPEPVNSAVRELRRRYGNLNEGIPVEITLAGSSGVGPIPVGTSVEKIRSEVDRLTQQLSPFQSAFRGLAKFPNTILSYLEPSDRTMFDKLHQMFIGSAIPFTDNPFPYNPHCTIRTFRSEEEYVSAAADPFPDEVFEINTISVYDFDTEHIQCELLHQVKL